MLTSTTTERANERINNGYEFQAEIQMLRFPVTSMNPELQSGLGLGGHILVVGWLESFIYVYLIFQIVLNTT